MLPDENDFSDSLTRAHREHRHAVQRRDENAARLLQAAIEALEATPSDKPARVEPPQMLGHDVATQRIHACRPDVALATIVAAVRHAMIALTVATGQQPSTEEVEAFALERLDR